MSVITAVGFRPSTFAVEYFRACSFQGINPPPLPVSGLQPSEVPLPEEEAAVPMEVTTLLGSRAGGVFLESI